MGKLELGDVNICKAALSAESRTIRQDSLGTVPPPPPGARVYPLYNILILLIGRRASRKVRALRHYEMNLTLQQKSQLESQ